MPKITVIGAGRVGKTLGRLWRQHGIFQIGDVLNRRIESARAAATFIGAGRPIDSWSRLEPADLYMLSVPDDALEACAQRLARAGIVVPGSIVLHCSGSKPSSVLAQPEYAGARVASLHPVKSFADPAQAAESFAGTYCALEGDPVACATLQGAIERCGGHPFEIQADRKLVYHAGTVFASNYLVGLAEVALKCFEQAGVQRAQALSIAVPLLKGTIENVSRLGTVEALTGPIARGDADLVEAQHRALAELDRRLARLYACLGREALELSAQQGSADASSLERIAKTLESSSS